MSGMNLIFGLLLLPLIASAATDDAAIGKTLEFKDGEYSLVTGAAPCLEGFVGWMTDQPNSSFMLGHQIVFKSINKGPQTKKTSPEDKCTFTATATAQSKELLQITKVDCPDEKVERTERARFKGDSIDYSLEILSDGKRTTKVSCLFQRDK